MIPKQYIIEWSETAPWINNYQIEQDLVIERSSDCILEEGKKVVSQKNGESKEILTFQELRVGILVQYFDI